MATPSAQDEASQIEAVLFDYGQVLSGPPNPAAWARMRFASGLNDDRLHDAYWIFRHDYDRATLTGEAYWRAVASRAGVSFTQSQIATLLREDVELWTDLNIPMVEWAAHLQAAGTRTAILSNIGDSIATGIIAKLPWLSAFEHCTWSHALFLAKPEPEIFLQTAAALRLPPSRILFIDDREDNIAAAAALGFQTIRYTTHPEFEREMQARGLASLLHAQPRTPITTAR